MGQGVKLQVFLALTHFLSFLGVAQMVGWGQLCYRFKWLWEIEDMALSECQVKANANEKCSVWERLSFRFLLAPAFYHQCGLQEATDWAARLGIPPGGWGRK